MNHTQEDTFNRLCRPSWDEMSTIIDTGFRNMYMGVCLPSNWSQKATQLYKDNHWTEEEFISYARKNK